MPSHYLFIHRGDATPEPPVGSVVIGEGGDAWQRKERFMFGGEMVTEWAAPGMAPVRDWNVLVDGYGPLIHVWTPSMTSDAPTRAASEAEDATRSDRSSPRA